MKQNLPFLFLRLNSWTKWLTGWLSKSSPLKYAPPGLDLQDTGPDSQERHIEGSSSEIEDEDVAFTLDLLVKTVGDGSGGGSVDDTEDVEAGDHNGVLGGGTLGVIEAGGDGNDGLGDGGSEVGLSRGVRCESLK